MAEKILGDDQIAPYCCDGNKIQVKCFGHGPKPQGCIAEAVKNPLGPLEGGGTPHFIKFGQKYTLVP